MSWFEGGSANLDRLIVSSQLVLSMLAMGTHHGPRDFYLVFRYPRSFLVGICCQFLLVPFLAVSVAKIAGLNAPLTLGIFLVAVMPGGPFSALMTHLGKGNTALAVSLTLFTTVASVVTVPGLLWLMSAPRSELNSIPWIFVVREVVLYLLIPLLIGMFFIRRLPMAHFAVRWGVRSATLLLGIYVAMVFTQGRISPAALGWGPPTAIVVFCVLAQQSSMVVFRIFRWPREDRLAVGIEMTIRDINLALLLNTSVGAHSPGQADPTLFAILFYGGTSLVVAFISVLVFQTLGRRKKNAVVNAGRSAVRPSQAEGSQD
jgi:BASS family bile acid:Na+ symporter